jgi:TonB family protein
MTNLPGRGLRALTVPARWAVPVFLLMAVSCQAWAQSKPPAFSVSLKLKSDPKGADLGPFMSDMYKSIKQKAQATMPNAVSLGEQGVVIIQIQIQKDGSLASPAPPEIVIGSGKKALDDHALGAIRKAAPFAHLPDATPVPVVLWLSFYYNTAPTSR